MKTTGVMFGIFMLAVLSASLFAHPEAGDDDLPSAEKIADAKERLAAAKPGADLPPAAKLANGERRIAPPQANMPKIKGVALTARSSHASCRIDFAIAELGAAQECSSQNNLSLGDFSEEKSALESDKFALSSAAAANDSEAFKDALQAAEADMKDAAAALRDAAKDAAKNKALRAAAIACAREKQKENRKAFATCQSSALKSAKDETLAYYDKNVERLQGRGGKLKAKGIEAKGVDSAFSSLAALRSSISSAFDTGNQSALFKERLKFTRAAINLHSEEASALISALRANLGAGNNTNKDAILAKLSTIETKIALLKSSCPQATEVADTESFQGANKACFATLKEIAEGFKEIQKLYKEGRAGVVALSGTGTLTAGGDGIATLKGSGAVKISAASGEVTVGAGATVSTEGDGTKQELGDGRTLYKGYGSITISGDNLDVKASGNNISLEATGSGRAALSGKGTYKVSNEQAFAIEGTFEKEQ